MTATATANSFEWAARENLGLELTTRCNTRCKHCFARAGSVEETSLTLKQAKQICAEGYAAGYRHLQLTGGEPLLWDDLCGLLDAVFEMGYRSVLLNTNGTLVTTEAARRLARYQRLDVSVSLQGNAALHDRMRGPDAYRQASRGIMAALDAGVAVTVFAALGRSLLTDLAAFATGVYHKFSGITCLTLIQMIRIREDYFDLSRELLEPEDFLRMVRTAAALNLCGFRTDVLNDPLVNVAGEYLRMPWIPPSHSLCRPGRIVVRANRDITLAHSTWNRYGRYRHGMITKVLQARRYRAAVAPDDAICPSCRFVTRCRANGLIRPPVHGLDMHSAIPYCQRVLTRATQDSG